MASGDKSAILKLREPLTFILPVLPLVPLQNGNLPYPCFLHIHGNVKYSKGVNLSFVLHSLLRAISCYRDTMPSSAIALGQSIPLGSLVSPRVRAT